MGNGLDVRHQLWLVLEMLRSAAGRGEDAYVMLIDLTRAFHSTLRTLALVRL